VDFCGTKNMRPQETQAVLNGKWAWQPPQYAAHIADTNAPKQQLCCNYATNAHCRLSTAFIVGKICLNNPGANQCGTV
jgi:hypothetical protein